VFDGHSAAESDAGLGPRKVREIQGVPRTALNQALKWGLVSRNAAALTDPPKVEAHEGTR
jgi:hypothetical protein